MVLAFLRIAVVAIVFNGTAWAEPMRPTEVLIGTDVIPLKEIVAIPLPANPAGRYRIEIGGAEVTLEIVPDENGWLVNRAYFDPGFPPLEAQYVVSRQGDQFTNDTGSIALVWGQNGVLAHETESGEEPPSYYWLYYAPE